MNTTPSAAPTLSPALRALRARMDRTRLDTLAWLFYAAMKPAQA